MYGAIRELSVSEVAQEVSQSNFCEGNVYITAKIHGHKLTPLVDTGSSTNLISNNLVHELGLTDKVVQSTYKLVGVTGAPLQTLGVLQDVPIVINEHLMQANFIVSNLFNEDCILGQSFMTKHKIVLNFNDLSMGNHVFKTVLQTRSCKSGKIMLITAQDTVVRGLDTISCKLVKGESQEPLSDACGLFNIVLDEQFDCISLLSNDTPHIPTTFDLNTIVESKNGMVDIPIAIDSNECEIWLPKNSIIAEAVPTIYSTSVEQQYSEEINFNSDDDPDRIAAIMSALKIHESTILTEEQKKQVRTLIEKFPDTWALDRSELGRTDLVTHEIHLSTDKPVRAPYRRVPLHLRADCIKELEELLETGIIEQSQSDYNTPALVLKRGNKTRIILDFRALNAVTIRSYATVPALNTILAGCHGAKMFSSLDFRDGFLQVPLKPEHRKYTAFAIPGIGFFQFTVLALGLCGSPGTFQNLLDRILAGCPPEVASAFVDDILSPAPDFDTMLSNLYIIFGRIKVSKLRLNPAKCQLFQSRLKYCGVYLTEKGVEADQEKVRAILDMQIPKTIKDVRRFLGCCSWFRQHIKGFATLAQGLTDSLKCDKLIGSTEFVNSVNLLKQALSQPPVLIFPSPNKEMLVYTDASEIAIAGCIGHKLEGQFHPIAYSSKILNETERKWASFKREFYSLWYHVTVCWRFYLLNGQFSCYVDMKALTFESFLKKTNSAVLLRWILELSADYSFTIKYLEGKLLDVPDCLSRLPQTSDQLFHWWKEINARELNSQKAQKDSANGINTCVFSQSDKCDSSAGKIMQVHTKEVEIGQASYDVNHKAWVNVNRVSCGDLVRVDLVSRDLVSGDLVSGKLVSRDLVSGDLVSGELVSRDLVSGDLVSGDLVSGEIVSRDLVIGDLVIGDYATNSTVVNDQCGVNIITADPESVKSDNNRSENDEEAQDTDITLQDGALKDKDKGGSFQYPIPAYYSDLLKNSQQQDKDLCTVKEWLLKSEKPSESTEIAKFSAALHKFWRYFEHMCLSDKGLVCYKFYFSSSKKFKELICVPEKDQEDLIRNHHDLKSCGHLGPQKTLHRIRQKYYFESMTSKVKQFCATCGVCFSINETYRKNPRAPLKIFPSCRPGQYLSIDLIGRIEGPCSFKWIFTMVDKFTRFINAVPLRNAEAPTIANALMNCWIWLYGVPEQILSDRAGNLTTANTMKILYSLMSVYKAKTTAYHAQGNGQCENYNKHIVVVLKKLVEDNPSSWPSLLPPACFALNSSVCSTTKFTPFRLHFGREIRGPSDLIYDTTTTEFYKSGAHLATSSFYEIRQVFDLVRQNNVAGLMSQKAAYDKRKGFHTTYKIGDHVLLWKPLSPTIKHYRKFRNCFSGPWKIMEILSQWTYRIKNVGTGKEEMAHYDSLRFVPVQLRSTTTPPRVSSEPEKVTTFGDSSERGPACPESEDEDLQMMFDTDDDSQEHPHEDPELAVEIPQARPVRDRRPPPRLQVDIGAGPSYMES